MNATNIFNLLIEDYKSNWQVELNENEIVQHTSLSHPFIIRLQNENLIDMKMWGNYTSISIQNFTAQELNKMVQIVKEQFEYFKESWTKNPDAWK